MVSMVGPSFQTDGNICIPQYADVEKNLERLSQFQPQDNDFILCSYPKSGTHWVNEIMRMLVTGVAEYNIDPINNLESGNYDDSDLSKPCCPRVLHTHLPHDMLPKSITERKIIYVIRDPRDQIVSLYHHHQGLKWTQKMSFVEFFHRMMNNTHKVEYGHWFRNPYQWWLSFRYSGNVLFLFYEDLIKDLNFQITRIAKFHNLNVTQSFISEVTKKTKFTEMKYKKPIGDWFTQWHKDSFSIYRKGTIGNWEMYFTPEMERAISAFFRQNMVGNCEYPIKCQLHIKYLSRDRHHADTAESVLECQQEVAMAH